MAPTLGAIRQVLFARFVQHSRLLQDGMIEFLRSNSTRRYVPGR